MPFNEIQTRAANINQSSIDDEKRIFEVVFTTGAGVVRYDHMGNRFVEELEVSETAINLSRLKSGAPLLDSHASYGTEAIKGVVEDAWIEGNKGCARIRVLKDDEDADKFWNKISQKIIRNISVGYSIENFEETTNKNQRTIKATSWTPLELSVVAIPADADAQIRSLINKKLREKKMDDEKDKTIKKDEKAEEKRAEEETEEEENDYDEKETKTPPKKEEERKFHQDNVREILDICVIAGLSSFEARSYIETGKSAKQIRSEIIKKRAENTPVISNTLAQNTSKTRSLSDIAKAKYKG